MQGLKQGDSVFLVHGSIKKARGVIHSIDASQNCGFELIGATCVAIHVLESFDDTFLIPFITMDATTMSQAVGSIIKWPLNDIVMDKGSTNTIDADFEEFLVGQEDGLIDRESWKEKRVILWADNRSTKFGNGVVLLVHPYEAINYRELGDSSLGVIVEGSLHASASDISSLNLVSWPIRQVTFENGEPLIKDTRSSSTIEGIQDPFMEEMEDPLHSLDAFSEEYEDDDIDNNTKNSFEGGTTSIELGLLLHAQNDREQDAMANDYDIIDGTTKKRSYVHN